MTCVGESCAFRALFAFCAVSPCGSARQSFTTASFLRQRSPASRGAFRTCLLSLMEVVSAPSRSAAQPRRHARQASKGQQSISTTQSAQALEHEESCLMCSEPIVVFAVGACNHRVMCGLCALRWRELYKDKRCPMCKVHCVLDRSSPLQ